MTEEMLQADMQRWRDRGEPEELVQKWARNIRADGGEFRKVASRATEFYNKVRGAAPGTPIEVEPVVITKPVCQHCGGAKFVVGANNQLLPCSHCDAEQEIAQARAERVQKYSSSSARGAAQTFRNFHISGDLPSRQSLTDCRAAAMEFAEAPLGWLIIWGGPGNGKSHLAAAVHNELKSRNSPAIYISAPDLLNSLKRLMDDETAKAEGQTYAERLDIYKNVPVLVLDDLGAEHGKEWRDSLWFELFDWRYRQRLATFITTNVNPADESLNFRLRSRMLDQHDGFVIVIHNTAVDHRITESLAF